MCSSGKENLEQFLNGQKEKSHHLQNLTKIEN